MLAPTRELAAQIHREFERLSRGKKFKGMLLTKVRECTQRHAAYAIAYERIFSAESG